ncbi:hypothetical protein O0I10_006538 [Lichtheimia ornata]|uniref:Uncharacterized protein n=1 Tax=Lichtheimia ornata TaxID=688661 RepID=A0AAD7V1P7_9FUNG|nr:uncharacterized protein O0I10_006538 [Lichtheimia ornata]KAJ8657723.1 hypothetical protein O0I10_006538 [Lichtheimia ornata]
MGIKNIDLLDEPFPDLFCGVCQDILEDPVQVHCPEDHIFCSNCINNYTKQQATCPVCQIPVDPSKFQSSKFVQRQIGRLRIRCPYHQSGCTWQGFFSDDHPRQCAFEPAECPNANRGCKERVQRTEIDQHRARCPFELLTCPNLMPLCEPYLRKDKDIHEKNCRSYPCHYGLSGCPFVGTLVEVNAHCEIYCGKLHQRLKELEDECARLKKIVSNYENGNEMQASKQSASALDDMDLLQQVLNNDDYLNLLNATPDSKPVDQHPMPATAPISGLQPTPSNMSDLMDLSDCLTPAPINPSGTPSLATIPKRAPNGKIIRYSKNARLAQSARRMARQQQAQGLHELSPFDALLEELDIRSPSSMHALSPPPPPPPPTSAAATPLTNNNRFTQSSSSQANNPFSFKNLDDVSKFLADFPEPVPSEDDTRSKESTSRYPPSPSSKQLSSQQRKSGTERKKASISTSVRSPKAVTSPSPSNHTSPSPAGSAAPKRNMFVLASSYLTNYGNNNNNNNTSSSSNSNNRSTSNNA